MSALVWLAAPCEAWPTMAFKDKASLVAFSIASAKAASGLVVACVAPGPTAVWAKLPAGRIPKAKTLKPKYSRRIKTLLVARFVEIKQCIVFFGIESAKAFILMFANASFGGPIKSA